MPHLLAQHFARFAAALLVLLFMGHAGAADPDVKIRIAYPSGMNGIYPVVMEKANIAAKHGLNAEFIFFQNGPPMMEALASGNVDAVITSLMPITTFLSRQPGKAVLVAQLGYSSHSLMTARGSSLRSVKDLKGKKIAVSFGTDSHLDLLQLIKSSGLDAGDLKLLNTPPNELMVALSQNFADAVVIRQPQVARLQEQMGAQTLHTWPFRFLAIMRSDYLDKTPGARIRFLGALKESVYYAGKHRDQASGWFAQRLRIDPKIVRKLANEDPAFSKVASLDDVSIALTPGFQKLLDDWSKASLEAGLIRSPAVLK